METRECAIALIREGQRTLRFYLSCYPADFEKHKNQFKETLLNTKFFPVDPNLVPQKPRIKEKKPKPDQTIVQKPLSRRKSHGSIEVSDRGTELAPVVGPRTNTKTVISPSPANIPPKGNYTPSKSSSQNLKWRSIEHEHHWITRVGTAGDWTHTHTAGTNLEKFKGTHSHPGNNQYGEFANNSIKKLWDKVKGAGSTLDSKPNAPTDTVKQTYGSQSIHVYSSKVSRYFHRPNCVELRNVSYNDRMEFPDGEKAIREGAMPCEKCNP